VSIVKAGANQTPIRSIKMDDLQIEEKDLMTTITALKAEGHEVVRVALTKGDKFPDAHSATKWLQDGGYPTDGLDETDDAFVVTNKADEFDPEVAHRDIEIDGVVVTVGRLAEDAGETPSADEAAEKAANSAGSVVTDVTASARKEDGAEAEAGVEVTDDARPEEGDVSAEAEAGEQTAKDEGEEVEFVKRVHGVDGKNKEVKTTRKRTRAAQSRREMDRNGTDPEAAPEGTVDAEAEAAAETDTTKDDNIRVVTVGDDSYEFTVLDAEAAKELQVPAGSFEVEAEKVELLGGDCGPGHTMIRVGGRSVCVPTGDVSGISQDEEVGSTPAPGGGQGSAGFGGTSPAAGQTQRAEGEGVGGSASEPAAMRQRFDEFAAHFSEGKTIKDVMEDSNDGIPPGFESLVFAMVMAMRNNFLDGDASAVRSVGTEFGEIASELGEIFMTAVEREERKAAIDAVSGTFAEVGWTDDGEDSEAEDSAKSDATLDKMAQAIGDLALSVKEGFSAIREEVTETRKRIDTIDTDLTERVAKVEDQTNKQTRKAVSEGDLPSGSTTKTKGDDFARRNLMSSLGSTKPRG